MDNQQSSPGYIEDMFNSIDYDFLEEIDTHELDDCYLSSEELQSFLAPSSERWNDVSSRLFPTLFTIDQSKVTQWELAMKEIDHVRGSVKRLLGIPPAGEVSIDDIVMYTLDPSSSIGLFLQSELDIDKETYLRFFIAVLIQGAHRISCEELFFTDGCLKDFCPVDQKEYNDIWKKISSVRKLPPNIVRTCRCDPPLWQMLETKLNDLLKKISIANHTGKISMSLDDDKIWFASAASQVSDLFNLKFTTHVKANRKGIVAHTAVTTGIMIPLAIAFERTGDTCLECMKRILGGLFGCMSSFPDLRNVHIHSDRGYMYPDMVFEFLLKQGAEILGTCKRMAQCWPFTYNQKMKENDKRTWIDVKGAPTLFLKYCKAGAKHVFASAFRNGTQSVATAISSIHKTHEWEGVAMNPSEYFAYKKDSSALCTKFFCRVKMDGLYDESADNDEKEVIEEFLTTKIVPYTIRQGTADWHYLRKFSLTSSQANKSFEVAMPAYKNDLSWIAVAEYLHGNSWHEALSILEDEGLPLDEPGTVDDTTGGDETNIVMYLSDFTTMQQLRTSQNHDEAIFQLAVDRLRSFTGSGDEDDNEMILGSNDSKNEYNSWNRRMQICAKDIISSYNPHQLPMKSIGNKEMISWLQNPNAVRNIMFYTCESLKLIMKKRNLVIATGRPTLKRMIDVLAGIDVENVQRQDGIDHDSSESVVLNHEDAAARAVIERSFLPHQKGPKREYSSLGHRLEIPILQKWIEKSESLGISIKGAYSTGLAAKQGEEYAKDSIDFILVVKDGGPLKAWGFEAKGRVTAATAAQEEQNLINSIHPHRRISEHDVFDFVLDPGERFQLLHHAYVYDLEAVVIAIGDSQSEILRSAIVDFSARLKMHYGNVLRKLKDIGLSWAYPENPVSYNQVLDIPSEVMELASTIPTINGEETLQGTLNLWYAISGMPKPIPSLVRIIPSIYAFWNVVKGGSDTTTKLMDSCLIQIPKIYMNTESVAVTRCLMLVMVCNLRLMQVFTAKSDINFYPSLLHYRQAASQRMTFHMSLLKSAAIFRRALQKCNDSLQSSTNAVSFQSPTAAPRQNIRRTNRRAIVDGVIPTKTNFGAVLSEPTPKRLAFNLSRNKANDEQEAMNKKCTGIPMKDYPPKNRALCDYCKKHTTSWYCIGCKQWFCLERKVTNETKEKGLIDLYYHTVQGKERHFMKACYHKKHEAAWRTNMTSANKEN